MHELQNEEGDSNQYHPRKIFSTGSDDEAISDEADVISLSLSLCLSHTHMNYVKLSIMPFFNFFPVDSIWTLAIWISYFSRKVSAFYMK